MREKIIEQKLVTAVKNHGGICPKFVSPGFDGMPDRLLLLPHGRFAFVEVKAPNQGTDYSADWGSRCLYWTTLNRLER